MPGDLHKRTRQLHRPFTDQKSVCHSKAYRFARQTLTVIVKQPHIGSGKALCLAHECAAPKEDPFQHRHSKGRCMVRIMDIRHIGHMYVISAFIMLAPFQWIGSILSPFVYHVNRLYVFAVFFIPLRLHSPPGPLQPRLR